MTTNPNKLSNFWQELKRRRVVHVIIVYATAAFFIIELINNVTEPLKLPEWTPTLVIIILLVGFPLAIIFSWIFDVTPEGIEKTKAVRDVEKEVKAATPNSWRIATYVCVVVIIGLIAFNIFRSKSGNRIDESLTKSIAVLPFHNYSGDSDQDYICLGLTDEIINHLYKVESFDEVRSLTSVLTYGDAERNIPLIAQELDVNYILEGSYKRMGDELRITAQLIEPESDKHIWLKDYELPYNEIIGIPGEIALQIADHLKVFLADDEQQSIEKNPTNNHEAYNLYLKAYYFQNTRSREGMSKAVEYYQEAIHLDPDYAIAYSGLANSYALQVYYGYVPLHENLPKAKEAAAKALEIDDKLGEAHLSLGSVALLEEDIYRTEQEYKLAILLSPKNAEAHSNYSAILPYFGKNEEAIREAKIALELEPMNPVMMRRLGSVYYCARQYDLAIKECNKCLEIDPGQLTAYRYLIFSYCQKAMYDDAITALEKNLTGRELEDIAELIRQTYEESGFITAIRQLLDVSMEKSIGYGTSRGNRSRFFASIGDTDKALEWCEKFYKEGGLNYDLKVDPIYDSLRSDPRFQELVDRMNFP